MSCAVLPQPNTLVTGPIVVTCTAPVTAPVPIPIPAHIPDPVPLSVSIVAAQSTPSLGVPVPVRPAFNWRNTTDRLREGLHRPLPFELTTTVRRHRQSVFQEMLHDHDHVHDLGKEVMVGNDGGDADDLEYDDDVDIDEILPRSRPRPASGIFLTNFLRLGLDDEDSVVDSPAASVRKRMSWSPAMSPTSPTTTSSVSRTWSVATGTTSTTAATASSSSGMTDRKRRWYAKLGGGGSLRLARKRSFMSTMDYTK